MIMKELNFPIVNNKKEKIGYGGNQEWFSQKWKQKSGCGCTSGANLAAYYAANHPELAGLYKGNESRFDQAEYVKAMEEMYTYMKPGILGYPYGKRFGRQFVEFCRKHGVRAEFKYYRKLGRLKKRKAFDFVKESIDSGNPVALLILFHRADELKEDNWHWVTITGYAIDEENPENYQVIFSNCGERQIVNGHRLFEAHKRNALRMVSFRIL